MLDVGIMAHRNVEKISYDDGSEYEGEVGYDNMREGFGLFKGADGSVYLGKWAADMYHGEGVYLYADGERY